MNNVKLNLASLLHNSQVNGPGKRDIFWVQGCAIKCKGCFNKHLWDFAPKYIVSVSDLLKKMKARKDAIEGVSILGGEPMHQAKALSYFLEGVQFMNLSTVVYTGFTYQYLLKQNQKWIMRALSFTDILIDGPYNESLQDKSLIWRGSKNQSIHFLSSRYSKSDIPLSENYHHAELHVFPQKNNGDIDSFRTGIL